uniref:RING-Gid-type domain-containing protein n=1 Tax=Ditylenchus dipsaci TaxID=166011 RepID=A0A915E871_9BILA
MATRKKHYCTDVLSYPVISKENKGSKPGSTGFWRIYEYLFHEGSWLQLEQDLATALTELHCPLATILNVGAKSHSFPAYPPLIDASDSPRSHPSHRRTSSECSTTRTFHFFVPYPEDSEH